MPYYMLTGEELNTIVAAAPPAAVMMSPSADPLFPVTQLYDGRPYCAAKWVDVTPDPRVTVDINQVPWPGFESSTPPLATPYAGAWTSTGTITWQTTIKNSGAASIQLSSGSTAYVDILVRPGQLRTLKWAIRSAGAGSISLALRNLHTGRYLKPGPSWADGVFYIDTSSDGVFQTGSVNYQVESLADCGGAPLVWLRISGVASGDIAYLDDIYDYPAIDFCGAFGTQNWDPVLAPQLRSSTDNFSSSDVLQASMTFAKPVISVLLAAPVYYRYWRLKLLGTPRVAPGLGELVFGQSQVLTKAPKLGPRVTWSEVGQIRRGALSGATRARNMGPWPTREVQMSWRFETQAQWRQFRDELFRGSRGGAIPTILLASDTTQGLDYGLFGMLSETFSGRRLELTQEYWDVDLELIEQPFPSL